MYYLSEVCFWCSPYSLFFHRFESPDVAKAECEGVHLLNKADWLGLMPQAFC